jgi:uncharacterized membrane protein YfcA
MLTVVLTLIVAVNGIFAILFLRDFIKHKEEAWKEKGNNVFIAGFTAITFFFSTFGISDFAMSTIVYRAKKLVSDKKLPGTLNTQCVIPVAVMALAYISVITVDTTTLIVCIIAQVLGAYIGPRIVVRLPEQIIRRFIGTGLIIASFLIVAGKVGFLPIGGEATALAGIQLVVAAIALFVFGALNNIGIGCYAPTMVTVFALGLSPAVTFPIMMGACTFSVATGSVQFVKFGEYSRKITLLSSIFGVVGVLAAVYIVKSLNLSMLMWLVAAVVFIAGIDIVIREFIKKPPILEEVA